MPHMQIMSRWAGVVLFEGEFSTMRLCVEAAKSSVNLRLANLIHANLSGANLSGANLSDANLSDANLSGAKIRRGVTLNRAPVRRAVRVDGYEFFLLDTSDGWRVMAGCRWFTFEEARAHWSQPRGDYQHLNDEALDILVMFSCAMDREEGR